MEFWLFRTVSVKGGVHRWASDQSSVITMKLPGCDPLPELLSLLVCLRKADAARVRCDIKLGDSAAVGAGR